MQQSRQQGEEEAGWKNTPHHTRERALSTTNRQGFSVFLETVPQKTSLGQAACNELHCLLILALLLDGSMQPCPHHVHLCEADVTNTAVPTVGYLQDLLSACPAMYDETTPHSKTRRGAEKNCCGKSEEEEHRRRLARRSGTLIAIVSAHDKNKKTHLTWRQLLSQPCSLLCLSRPARRVACATHAAQTAPGSREPNIVPAPPPSKALCKPLFRCLTPQHTADGGFVRSVWCWGLYSLASAICCHSSTLQSRLHPPHTLALAG